MTNINIGSLVISPDSRVVTLGAHNVRLSIMEHKVLLVLARNRKWMHQAQIIREVYGNDPQPPTEKIVDVFICKIRKKFRRVSPVGQYIESVPGAGYRVKKAPALLSA